MFNVTTKRTITALVIVAAILAPTASARPIDQPGVGFATTAQPPSEVHLRVEHLSGANPASQAGPASLASAADARPGGFDWGDAGVGAAVMMIAVGLAVAGTVAIRRREHGGPALTS